MPVETIELQGHIIDSLTLPKVLDAIVELGGQFVIERFDLGKMRGDPSLCRIRVETSRQEPMDLIVQRLRDLGARVQDEQDVTLAAAPKDGAFPEHFYATTNLQTQVRLGGRWIDVARTEMDKGIVVDHARTSSWTVPMAKIKKGEMVVVGDKGVRVLPQDRPRVEEGFSFMTSAVSTEKPKLVQIHAVAQLMRQTRAAGNKILLVGGPAIIHTGSGVHLVRLIENGYVNVLFAGNALAAHDIEQAIFGTSLGVSLSKGTPARHGHQHHLHAINMVRLAGGIQKAIASGLVRSGVMHACFTKGVKVVLAGSIRDDGPLPDVITDTAAAQDAMRAQIPGVGLALMIGTALHSVATGNMLPATVTTVAVDINATVVTKLLDRGSWQTLGIVTDTEPFLRELAEELCGKKPKITTASPQRHKRRTGKH
jgi:lysine-ketoglutarate reductase/saccharopine dehydrogenase-like protein (TIGR00300 family)